MELSSCTVNIAGGREGVRQTLRTMRNIVKRYKTDLNVRMRALELVGGLRQKDFKGQVIALHKFVRDHIRYVHDVHGVETLHTPDKILEIGQGDCDDKSILLASLLASIGHPTRFVAVARTPNRFSHVFVETRLGPHWVALETTEPWPAGKRPVGYERMVIHNR